MSNTLSRRKMIKGSLAATAGAGLLASRATLADDNQDWKIEKGRIKQSVVPWCFKNVMVDGEKHSINEEELAVASAKLGLKSVELCDPKFWPMLKKLGLTCAIAGSHGFVSGFNHVENHAMCIDKVTKSVEAASDFGCPSVICFSGMKKLDPKDPKCPEISDEEGQKNTVEGIKKIVGLAEKKKVTLCIEVLNSRVDINMKGHPGYQADTLEWAVKVCDKVGSPNFKILFDIYHIQIMEGDIITRIKQYKDYVGHYHTAGNPGRAEIDDSQEINYPPIIRAIVESGYAGFLGQEFIPRKKDLLGSLRQGVKICDI